MRRNGRLHGTFVGEEDADGLKEDFKVQGKRPVGDVLGVQTDDLFKVGDLTAAADLPEAGDTRLDGQAGAVVVLVLLPLVHGRGAGTDHGHRTLEDVEKLRKFVQRGFADKLADASLFGTVGENLVADDAGVEIELEHHAVLHAVLFQQLFLALFGVHVHGADLIHLEPLAVLADALLGKEDGTRRLVPDDRADDSDDHEGGQTADQAGKDIEEALDDELERGGIVDGGREDRGPADLFGKAFCAAAAHVGDVVMGGNAHPGAGVHQLHDLFIGHRGINIDGIDPFADNIVSGGVHVRDNGIPGDFFGIGGFRQDDSDDLVVRDGVTAEAGENVICGLGRANHQHAVLFCAGPAAFFQNGLPAKAGKKGKQEVEKEGQGDQDTGIGVTGLRGEHIDRRQGEDISAMPEGGTDLGIKVPVHDVVHGVVQDQHEGINEDIEKTDVPIEGGGIDPVMMADGTGKNKSKLQTEFIEDEKIKVLGPALGVSLINGEHPL